MKKSILTLICIIVCAVNVANAQTKMSGEEYAEMYKDIAVDKMRMYGIPASITLAQGILESAFGSSPLAVNANNHFGIKCGGNWTGQAIRHDDDHKQECFRKYRSVEDSYRDHSEFLKNGSRYANLFKLKPYDYKGWAVGLKEAGYATNPEYANKLIELIERYDLQKYDRPESRRGIIGQTVYTGDGHAPKVEPRSGRVWGKTNGVKYILAETGDTWQALADEYKLSLQGILHMNDLPATIPIIQGDKIYMQYKKNKNVYVGVHTVAPQESKRDIAQQYGVKQSSIEKLNVSIKNREPKAGELIRLNN